MDTIKDKLRHYLLNEILTDVAPDDLADNYNLIESGLLDSLATMNLISLIQTKFNIELDGTEITEENFASIEAMASFIENCISWGGASLPRH